MSLVNTSTLSLEQLQRVAAGEESADKHVLELLESLNDGDEEVRAWASDALQTIETLPTEWASGVAEKCLDGSAPVAAAACRLLTKLAESASQHQAAIANCLRTHAEISARQQAALALGSIPELSTESLEALKQASESPDPRLKRLAIVALETNPKGV